VASHPLDLASIDWLLTTTRTVRKRLDLTRPVPQALLLECVDLALQAPTGGNYQGWRWIVVRDPDKKASIAAINRRALADVDKGGTPADDAARRMVEGARYLADHLADVPVLVIACVQGRLQPSSPPARAASLYGSIYPAIWSFQLALRSRGLCSAFTTAYLAYERDVAELLGIPDRVTQAAMLPVAYPLGDDFRAASRQPASQVTFSDEWGNMILDAKNAIVEWRP
jgi:nitroreductase